MSGSWGTVKLGGEKEGRYSTIRVPRIKMWLAGNEEIFKAMPPLQGGGGGGRKVGKSRGGATMNGRYRRAPDKKGKTGRTSANIADRSGDNQNTSNRLKSNVFDDAKGSKRRAKG